MKQTHSTCHLYALVRYIKADDTGYHIVLVSVKLRMECSLLKHCSSATFQHKLRFDSVPGTCTWRFVNNCPYADFTNKMSILSYRMKICQSKDSPTFVHFKNLQSTKAQHIPAILGKYCPLLFMYKRRSSSTRSNQQAIFLTHCHIRRLLSDRLALAVEELMQSCIVRRTSFGSLSV